MMKLRGAPLLHGKKYVSASQDLSPCCTHFHDVAGAGCPTGVGRVENLQAGKFLGRNGAVPGHSTSIVESKPARGLGDCLKAHN